MAIWRRTNGKGLFREKKETCCCHYMDYFLKLATRDLLNEPDRIAYAPVMEHWLEWEIAQWWTMSRCSNTELHFAPYTILECNIAQWYKYPTDVEDPKQIRLLAFSNGFLEKLMTAVYCLPSNKLYECMIKLSLFLMFFTKTDHLI